MQTEKHALIAGAGIGGLTAAIALQKIGYTVSVLEKAKILEATGAGITLWANAIKALEKLGLHDQIRDYASPALDGQIRDAKGKCLSKANAKEMAQAFGAPNFCFHRADLQQMLLDAVGMENVRLGAAIGSFEQNGQKVTAHLTDGQTIEGNLLVGADGIHSVVRRQLFGEQPLRYSGYVAWRGVVEFPAEQLIAGESWGCGQRFGIVPLNRGRVYWFATRNSAAGLQLSPAERKQELLELFKNWHKPIAELITATPETAILYNDIYDRPPIKQWSVGRVTLLGDAAHSTTPNLGQGGCQAIEDGLILADFLSRQNTVEQALKNYEVARIPRTTKVVKQSWLIGKVGQWNNPVLCKMRNEGLRLLPDKLQVLQMQQFAGYNFP